MDDGSTYWAAMGAIAVAIIGLVGNKWAKTREERQRRSEITTAGEIESSRTREARSWTLMEERIDDLEAERERLAAIVARQSELIDRIRAERDEARVQATDWQIEAHKASGAIARVTELQQQCEQERLQHAEEVRGLREQIAKLRKKVTGDEK